MDTSIGHARFPDISFAVKSWYTHTPGPGSRRRRSGVVIGSMPVLLMIVEQFKVLIENPVTEGLI